MLEDGALEASEDVNLNNDTYPKTEVCKIINQNEVVGEIGVFCFELRIKIKYHTKTMT